MPDGEQLLYLWLQNGKTNLNISPADLGTWQTVTDMWENDDDLAISPDGRTILFWRKGSTEQTNKINMVSPDGKLFRTVVKDGYNTGAVWSPDSQKFAFNRKSASGKSQLWVGNMFTGEVQNMNAELAVDKVAWSPDSRVLYGASDSQNSAQLLRIDVPTATQQTVDLIGSVQVSQPFFSADGRSLFFKNILDGGLYYVDVSPVQSK
jgi:Tol biopolymer transport system component